MIDRVLIWGAGAIGGTVGAHLARKGIAVTFVDVVREHVEAVANEGLEIIGPIEEFRVRVPAFLPQDLCGSWQHVFLAVKAQHTHEAAAQLAPMLAPEGYVVSLQNGLCELELKEVLKPKQVIGAFVNFGADWLGPGKIIYSGRGAFVVGELEGQLTSRLEGLLKTVQLFEPEAIQTDQIFSYLWGKLGYGSLLFAQALGQAGIADCLARSELLPLWRRLAGEVVRIALAENSALVGFNTGPRLI